MEKEILTKEFSEYNKKLIVNWDEKIKVRTCKFIFDKDKKIENIEITFQDSPFEDFLSKADVSKNNINKVLNKVIEFTMDKFITEIEKELNREDE